MYDTFNIISLASQCASAILVIVFFIKSNSSFYTILKMILSLTAMVEIMGFYNIFTITSGFNLYNIYSFLSINLISVFFFQVLDLKKTMTYIFFVISNLACFFSFTDKIPLHHLIILISVLISIYSFLYLRKLLTSEKIINYKKTLPFWVSVGFLVFYLPAIPFFSLLNYMTNRGLFFILDILIILMNLFIIYGILTCNKEEKY